MKIDRIEVFATRLPLAAAEPAAPGAASHSAEGAPHVYVKLTADSGAVGWGEARPNPHWSPETAETVVTTIRRHLAPALVGLAVDDEPAIHKAMHGAIAPTVHTGQPIAKSAIDVALCDLLSSAANQPLATWLRAFLGLQSDTALATVPLACVVSATEPDAVAREVAAGVAAGYEGFKLRIGLAPEKDAAILDAASQAAAGAFLWADACQAYGLDQAIEVGRAAERLGIDVFEQPLPAGSIAAQVELCKALDVPVVLDESVFDLLQLEELLRLKALDGVVVKVGKMGGLRPAARCAARALSAGLLVLGGGLAESRLGMTTSAALFAALGLDRPVDLAGPQFLADDVLPGDLSRNVAQCSLPAGPGLGLAPDPAKLERYTVRDIP